MSSLRGVLIQNQAEKQLALPSTREPLASTHRPRFVAIFSFLAELSRLGIKSEGSAPR
jgi:hypothetical protein